MSKKMRFVCCVISGHTFVPNHEVFLPKYQIDPLVMAMSVVNAGEATYRTVYFENVGPTPILFELDNDPAGLATTTVLITMVTRKHRQSYRHSPRLKVRI